jgi:hypothetical protein
MYLNTKGREKMDNLDLAKDEIQKLKDSSKVNIEDIFDIVNNTNNSTPSVQSRRKDHKLVHTLAEIREKLAATKKVKDENGVEVEKPVFAEDEKVRIIFGLLAEKGFNLLDSLEKILEKDGFRYQLMGDGSMEEGSNPLIKNINDTFEKTTSVLKEISEMQYKRSKLELEKENLRIQDYKAKLKEKELAIKEKAIMKGNTAGNTNIIAVASQAELIALMKSQKEETVKEVEVDDGEVTNG